MRQDESTKHEQDKKGKGRQRICNNHGPAQCCDEPEQSRSHLVDKQQKQVLLEQPVRK
jgi:hypothetical protein